MREDSSDEEGAHLPGKHQRPAKTVEDEPSPEKKKGKVYACNSLSIRSWGRTCEF